MGNLHNGSAQLTGEAPGLQIRCGALKPSRVGSIPMHFRHIFIYINMLAPYPALFSFTGRLQNSHICISTEKFFQAVFLAIRDQVHHKLRVSCAVTMTRATDPPKGIKGIGKG
jgi:hypothetical protein